MPQTNELSGNREQLLSKLLYSTELEQLEGMLGGFNIFEAIGAVNRELRHSDFLAFLLDPSRPHGLGSRILRNFAIEFFTHYNGDDAPSMIDVGCYEYETFTVYREWKNIDLLLVSEHHNIVIAIENKIWSGEHSNQLSRYQQLVETHYSGYQLYYGYLTPSGLPPESNDCWLALSYQQVAQVLTKTLKRSRSAISEQVASSLEQYLQMLERHILEDSEISRLCQKIYAQHRHALDLIFEHRPDQSVVLGDFIKDYVKSNQDKYGIKLDHCTKGYIRFAVTDWDDYAQQMTGQGEWTDSKRVLLFEFINRGDHVRLVFQLGPGNEEYRQSIFDYSCKHKEIFNSGRKNLSKKYHRLFSKNIMQKGKFNEDDDQEIVEKYLTCQIDAFFVKEFPNLVKHIDSVLK